jgi:hypothetical protein
MALPVAEAGILVAAQPQAVNNVLATMRLLDTRNWRRLIECFSDILAIKIDVQLSAWMNY